MIDLSRAKQVLHQYRAGVHSFEAIVFGIVEPASLDADEARRFQAKSMGYGWVGQLRDQGWIACVVDGELAILEPGSVPTAREQQLISKAAERSGEAVKAASARHEQLLLALEVA